MPDIAYDAPFNPCSKDDGEIVHDWPMRPCGDEERCRACDRVRTTPHEWGEPSDETPPLETCHRCGSRRVYVADAPPVHPVAAMKGAIIMAGYSREVEGYRALIVEMPVKVMRKYLISAHEPDIKQIAEAHVQNALLGDRG